MIIVKLIGGMGNQMFQYAAGRRAAWRHNTVLKLDLSQLQGDQGSDTPRQFALDHLRISAVAASSREVAEMSGSGRGLLGRVRQRLGLGQRGRLCREKHFHFDPQMLNIPDGCYLVGYWQSERYFTEIEELIRDEFFFQEPLSGEKLELAKVMQGEQSVSLHVRRGDYFSSAAINALHGTCTLRYFSDAAAMVASQLQSPRFFVFSDDTAWTKEYLRLPYPMTVVEHNGPDRAHEDMRLMSMCRHHIISNSSFSWWGAWLNPRVDKMVVAPSRWFNDASIDTKDLLPASWLRMAT